MRWEYKIENNSFIFSRISMHTAPVSIDNITNIIFLRLDTLTILILYKINYSDNLIVIYWYIHYRVNLLVMKAFQYGFQINLSMLNVDSEPRAKLQMDVMPIFFAPHSGIFYILNRLNGFCFLDESSF